MSTTRKKAHPSDQNCQIFSPAGWIHSHHERTHQPPELAGVNRSCRPCYPIVAIYCKRAAAAIPSQQLLQVRPPSFATCRFQRTLLYKTCFRQNERIARDFHQLLLHFAKAETPHEYSAHHTLGVDYDAPRIANDSLKLQQYPIATTVGLRLVDPSLTKLAPPTSTMIVQANKHDDCAGRVCKIRLGIVAILFK